MLRNGIASASYATDLPVAGIRKGMSLLKPIYLAHTGVITLSLAAIATGSSLAATATSTPGLSCTAVPGYVRSNNLVTDIMICAPLPGARQL
jgi:hypothetical protein